MPKTLVKVDQVSKKFCRSLRKSLWYGVCDMGTELLGRSTTKKSQLRPEEFWAVNEVSLEVNQGECLGLIGHNGAGKTTLLRMLNGLIKPDKGRIEMRGRVGALIALGAGFNPLLSGRENIIVSGMILGLTHSDIKNKTESIIEFSGLHDSIDAPVQSYSSGMIVRLGFSIAAQCHPDILLLDEVLAVGDSDFQVKCLNTISEVKRNGASLILVSHNLHHISRYSDKILYLDRGLAKFSGNVDQGINAYNEGLNSIEKSNTGPDWETVRGNGKAQITGLSLLNTDGQRIQAVEPNSKFTLLIHYKSREKVGRTILDLLIRDRYGVLFQGTNMDYGFEISALNDVGSISLTFAGIPTASDRILLYIALLEEADRSIMDWKRDIDIKLLNSRHLNGRLLLDISWSNLPELSA